MTLALLSALALLSVREYPAPAEGVLVEPVGASRPGTLVTVLSWASFAPSRAAAAPTLARVRLPDGPEIDVFARAVAVRSTSIPCIAGKPDSGPDTLWIATAKWAVSEYRGYHSRSLVVAVVDGKAVLSRALDAETQGGGEYWVGCELRDATGDGKPEVIATALEIAADLGTTSVTLNVLTPREDRLAPIAELTAPVFPGQGAFSSGGIVWAPGRIIQTEVTAAPCTGKATAGWSDSDTSVCLSRLVQVITLTSGFYKLVDARTGPVKARWHGKRVTVLGCPWSCENELLAIRAPGGVKKVPAAELVFDDGFLNSDLGARQVPPEKRIVRLGRPGPDPHH